MKYPLFFVIFLLSFFIVLTSCTEPTKPPVDNGPDTTSHDFSWTIDTIGTYGSYLKDVAIIDENNIWAVGEIHTDETDRYDSLGNWVQPFNAVHWNGDEWGLKRIKKENHSGWGPLYAIIYLGQKNIFVGGSIPLFSSDGKKWEFYGPNEPTGYEGGFGINSMWGTSPYNVYVVGNNGQIRYYDGQSWQRLESGTDINLLDVWGSPDGSVVWACGYTDFVGTVLLKITNQIVETVYLDNDNWFNLRQDSLSGVLTSIWTNNTNYVYVMTPNGMYKTPSDTRGQAERMWYDNQIAPGFPRRMRGQEENDIITVGDFHMIVHYNGNSWRYYKELYSRARWRSVDFKDNVTVAIGWDHLTYKALITIGKR